MPDLLIPGAALAAITAVLLSLTGAIGILFRALIVSKDKAIAREQELTDKLLPATQDTTRAVQENTRATGVLAETVRRLEEKVTRSER